jgi:hypothetical protein
MRHKIEAHPVVSDTHAAEATTDVHPTTTDRHHLHRPATDDQTGATAPTHDKVISHHHPARAATHFPTFPVTVAQKEATSAEEAAPQLAVTSIYRVTTAVMIRDAHANPTTGDNDGDPATRVIREMVHHRMREEELPTAIEIVRVGEGETREISGGIGEMDGLGVGVRKEGIGIEIRGGTIFIGGVRNRAEIKVS